MGGERIVGLLLVFLITSYSPLPVLKELGPSFSGGVSRSLAATSLMIASSVHLPNSMGSSLSSSDILPIRADRRAAWDSLLPGEPRGKVHAWSCCWGLLLLLTVIVETLVLTQPSACARHPILCHACNNIVIFSWAMQGHRSHVNSVNDSIDVIFNLIHAFLCSTRYFCLNCRSDFE